VRAVDTITADVIKNTPEIDWVIYLAMEAHSTSSAMAAGTV
jgi:hypothetical protein